MNFSPDAIHGLKCYKKYEDFMSFFEPMVERFPNYEKSAWCAQIKNHMIDIIRHMMDANMNYGEWRRVDADIEILRIFIRRTYLKHYLSVRAYEESMRRLEEIGRMLGGLQKMQASKR